jgi:eukaryotic-like serine/threonine-protein kinase
MNDERPDSVDTLADLGDVIVPDGVLSATWRLDRLLGSGGMATVYAATGLHGERAALKVMRPDLIMQPGSLQRFLREGVIARRVAHPGMVRCLGEGTTDEGRPYIALELLDGCTIDELWRSHERRPSLQNLLRFFVDVLDLLAECHRSGIVHRDLKPANIYVTRTGQPKVLDFGVARASGLSEEFLRPGTAMGTPSFMAPEQAMGAWDHVDARADVFSIGATLFAMLSGQRLHHGRSEAASFTLAATRSAPSLQSVAPALPVDVVAFVDRALQWDKRARFEDAGEMRDTLLQITLGLDPDDTPIAPPSESLDIDDVPPVLDSDAGQACAEAFRLLHQAWLARRDRQPSEPQLMSAAARLNDAMEAEVGGLTLAVLPWCLRLRHHVVWSPEAPFAAVLGGMFADGIRSIEFIPSCSLSAVRQLLDVLLERAEAAPDDASDFVCDLWLLKPEGIQVGVATGLLGASAGTSEVAANGRRTVSRLLESSGGVCERPPLLSARAATDVLLDDAARDEVASGVMRVAERDWLFAEQLVLALDELVPASASDHGEASSLLRSVAVDLLRDDRADLLLRTAVGVCEARDAEALAVLLPPDSILELIVALDRRHARNGCTADLQSLRATLSALGATSVPSVIQSLAGLESPEVSKVVADHIEQHLPNHAEAVAGVLLSLSGETGYRLVRALANRAPEVAEGPLKSLARQESSPLRIAAHAALHGAAHIGPAILEQFDAPGWRARRVALRTMADFEVDGAGDALMRLIESPGFHGRSVEERIVTLATLASIDPELAETAAQSLVRKHGLLQDDALNETRVIAADMLQASSRSTGAVEALHAVEAPMWWNPPHVREAARLARVAIETRLNDADATESS